MKSKAILILWLIFMLFFVSASGQQITEYTLMVMNSAFDKQNITVPVDSTVIINFGNLDSGMSHDFAVYTDSSEDNAIFKGNLTVGPAMKTYTFKAPHEPREYLFRCDAHPNEEIGNFIVTELTNENSKKEGAESNCSEKVIDGQITSVSWPDKDTYEHNEPVLISANFSNTGLQAHSFLLAYFVVDSTGKRWDAPTQETAVLQPGESGSIQISWQSPEEAPEGAYTATVGLSESNNNGGDLIKGFLDQRMKDSAFQLKPAVQQPDEGKSGEQNQPIKPETDDNNYNMVWTGQDMVQIDILSVDKLIQALKDGNSTIRATAAHVLGIAANDTRAVEPLIVALEDDDIIVRYNAAMSLGDLKDPRAVEPLIKALKDNDIAVQRTIVSSLGRIGDARAIEPLIQILEDSDSPLRASAASALGYFKDARAIELLIQALKDNDDTVRRNAAFSLGRIGDARAIEPLIQTLEDSDSPIRVDAASALRYFKDTRIIDLLIQALNDSNSQVRTAAVNSLGAINDSRAVEPLIKALRDNDSYVRANAIGSLGEMKDPQAIEPLIYVLRYDEASIDDQSRAAQALKDIGALSVEPLILALKDDNSYVRSLSAENLGYIKDKRAVEPLIQALQDNNVSVQYAAVNALGEINDTRAVEPLIQALKYGDNSLRLAAARALGNIKDVRAVEPLIKILKYGDDNSLRFVAAGTLGDIKDTRAVEPLIEVLRDNNVDMRYIAAWSLGEMNDSKAIEPLIQALDDNESSVRDEAAKALAKLGWRSGVSPPDSAIPASIETKKGADMDNSSSINISSLDESRAALDKAAKAIESQDKKGFINTISNDTLGSVRGDPDLSSPQAMKVAKGLREAKFTQMIGNSIVYEMVIDGATYSFAAIKEGREWKISGL